MCSQVVQILVIRGFTNGMLSNYVNVAGSVFLFLSFRLIPKKLMSSYTGMEECEKNKHNH